MQIRRTRPSFLGQAAISLTLSLPISLPHQRLCPSFLEMGLIDVKLLKQTTGAVDYTSSRGEKISNHQWKTEEAIYNSSISNRITQTPTNEKKHSGREKSGQQNTVKKKAILIKLRRVKTKCTRPDTSR